MAWYDFFSSFYDRSLEKSYRPFREQAFSRLTLEAGSSVLDLASGTGQNLPFLAPKVGERGRVFCLDTSKKMLERAKARATSAGYEQVECIEGHLRDLSAEELVSRGAASGGLDAVVCTLGLTVVPEWEKILRKSFALLRPGGEYLIMDVLSERWNPMKPLVEWIAQADIKRDVASELESHSTDFSRHAFPDASPWIFGGTLFVAQGRRGER